MSAQAPVILTVNTGSSSIKVDAYYSQEKLEHVFSITISGIEQGSAKSTLTTEGHEPITKDLGKLNYTGAIKLLFETLDELMDARPIAVGHRIVHGGNFFTKPTLLNSDTLHGISSLADVDPEHIPKARLLIQACQKQYPNSKQVGCFDTTFFADLPMRAKLLPIPRKYFYKGVRRYGFHGLSYTYLLEEFSRRQGHEATHGRIIMAHLGSGVSLCAVKDGKPIDTTMSYSPASGVMMSSRSGDIDPSAYWYLASQKGLGNDEVKTLLHSKSGLLGVSELSADMYELLQAEKTNPQAAEAVDLFCYQVKKTIGSYAAALGGVDSIIISGGMGENAPKIRKRILSGLEYLGVEIDPDHNKAQAEHISSKHSRVGVFVLKTNESRVIAQQTHTLLKR